MSDTLYDTELSVFDYIWITFILCQLFIILFFLCPCCICYQKYWKSSNFEGASEECYKSILKERGYDPNKKHKGIPLWKLILRQDLQRKMIWNDDKCLDFFQLIRNHHTCLSVCYGHRFHPFSRSNRCLVLTTIIIIDIAATLMIAYWLTFAFRAIQSENSDTNIDTNIDTNFDTDTSSDLEEVPPENDFVFYLPWTPQNETEELGVSYAVSLMMGFILYLIQISIIQCTTCGCCDRCCPCLRYCAYCVGKATILTFGIISALSLGMAVYFIYEVNSADNQIYYENVGGFWLVFVIQYVIGVSQAWFLIEIANLYIYLSRQWRHAHMETKEKIDKDRHCCVKVFCLCCNCLKWILFFFIIGCWKCLVWLFCPQWDDDGQDQFGVNYHEYTAWKNGDKVGKRAIPYKRMGTQNSFYAGNSLYGGEFVEEEGDETTFNAQDFLIKDLKVAVENEIELATMEGGNVETEKNENDDQLEDEPDLQVVVDDHQDENELLLDQGQNDNDATVVMETDNDKTMENEDDDQLQKVVKLSENDDAVSDGHESFDQDQNENEETADKLEEN